MKTSVQKMRSLFALFMVCLLLFSIQSASAYNGLWQQVDHTQVSAKGIQVQHPKKYLVYSLATDYLKQQLFLLSADPDNGQILELPLADGTFREFKVWQTPMMPGELAARYPNIKTFTAEAIGNHTVTAKIDFTEYGFHAMIFDGFNTSFIDPFTNEDQNYYMVHYKHDEYRPLSQRMKCLVQSPAQDELGQGEPESMNQAPLPKLAYKTSNGYQLCTYRLALCADNEYCIAATGSPNPTIAQAFSKMTTSMNRLNGVFEREFSITMAFVAKEDTLIWTQSTGTINGNDPFNSIDANAYACVSANQTTCNARIGPANYDIGHVFTTGAGGLSQVGCVCQGDKAMSVTGSSSPIGDGFDIDYVAHEMGHEYGSQHTFNDNNNGSCAGNAYQSYAFEPGSGSTIMCYAGICDQPIGDDLQPHSDAYFSYSSLLQIYDLTIIGSGNSCAVKTATSNKPAGLTPFTATYSLPYKTPFELQAPIAADSVADTSTTYCWEQANLGDFGLELINTHFAGPIFRSFSPVTSPLRVFPKMSMVLAGTLSDAGTENNQGEKAADTARFLTFKLTVRDIFQGNGCFLFPDDSIHLNVINTGAGFTVTSPTAIANWTGGSANNITWNVVSTNTAPISCDSVDIYISNDGGNTWPGSLGTHPNTGSVTIMAPNIATSSNVRIKVKGHRNVFFNVNGSDFQITNNPGLPTVTLGVPQINTSINDVKVYPNPATNIVNISAGNINSVNAIISITDITGKLLLQKYLAVNNGNINTWLDIKLLSPGLYLLNVKAGARQNVTRFIKEG